MKRKLLMILLMVGVGAFAQERSMPLAPLYEHTGESFLLDTLFQSLERNNFYASDYILLNPGFDCKGVRKKELGHNMAMPYDCTTDFKIDENSVYPPYYGQYGGPNPDDKGCVGAIGGNIDVSSLGGALYSIPIEVPAGINGMQPNLAVTYNSQGGNGLLGWCWDLSGLSSITRTGKTLYHDGEMGGVTLSDINDRFLLDGQRLIEVADYGTQIEYRTEQDCMAKIIAYCQEEQGCGLFGLGTIRYITKFKVWHFDGTILEYGYTDDSRIEPQNENTHALCWLLNKVSDRDGNSMTYHYQEIKDSGEYYVSLIDYCSNQSQNISPEFSVEINYYSDSRTDYMYSFVAGNIVQHKKLIKNIVIKDRDGNSLGSYSFQYRNGQKRSSYYSVSMFSRLESISFEKNGIAINPTRIKWKSDGGDVIGIMDERRSISRSIYDNFPFVGDFNGDGYDDLAVVPYKNDSMYYPNNINVNVHFNRSNASGLVFNDAPDIVLPNIDKSLDWIYVLDINDDGLSDLLLVYCDSVDSGITSHIMLYKNNDGTSFTPFLNNPFQINGEPLVQIGDFEGLGRNCFIALTKNENTINESHYFRFDGENVSIFPLAILGVQSNLQNVYQLLANDFMGNGRDQLFIMRSDCSQVCSLCYIDGQYDFREQIHNTSIYHPGNDTLPNQAFPGDYNGDGLTDLLYYSGNCQWKFYFSKGTCFDNPRSCGYFVNYNLPNYNLYCYSLRTVRNVNSSRGDCYNACPADFDGDGTTDVAIIKYDWTYSAVDVYFKFLPDNDNPNSCCYQSFFNSGYYNGGYGWAGIDPNHYYFGCKSQYLHLGTFVKKGCTSFLCLEYCDPNLVHHCSRRPGVFTFKAANDLNHVSTITDGLGNRIDLKYKWQMQPYCEYQYGVRRIAIPLHVLDSYSTYNATGKDLSNKYGFSNLCYHRDGHGYIGFLKESRQTSNNGVPVGLDVSYYSLEPMGCLARLLPEVDSSFVYVNGNKTLSSSIQYVFQPVSYGSNPASSLVNCPALTTKHIKRYDIDNGGVFMSKEINDYSYNYSVDNNSHASYDNAYGCDTIKIGNSSADVDRYDNCEFRTKESICYDANNVPSWIINRRNKETSIRSCSGKPDVVNCTLYQYDNAENYAPSAVTEIPSYESSNDSLTIRHEFEYYPNGNVKKESAIAPFAQFDEKPRTTIYHYGDDDKGRLVTEIIRDPNGLNYKTSYAYDNYDNTDSIIACNGLVAHYKQDAMGIDMCVENSDGTKSHNARRWAIGHVLNPNQQASYYTWSKTMGKPQTLTFYHKSGAELRQATLGLVGDTVIVDKRYNDQGLLDSLSNPYRIGETPQWTSFHYDNLGRLISTVTPDSTETRITYQGLTTRTEVIPPAGETHQTQMTNNIIGWTVSSIDSGNETVHYDYNADGTLASTRIGNLQASTVSFRYDSHGNRTNLDDPDYGSVVSKYNAFDELVINDTPKEKNRYQYDCLGRLIQKDNVTESVTTNYDYHDSDDLLRGTIDSIRYDNQTIAYFYDEFARNVLTRDKRQESTYETKICYDECARISSIKYPTGFVTVYTYSPTGLLSSICDANGELLWRTDSINASGLLVQSTMGNGVVTHRTYDSRMNYLRNIVSSNNLQNLSYSYDKFGNLASRKDNKRNLEETFTYDNLNRLTGITMNGMTASMTYDNFGRMTAKEAVVMKNGTPQVAAVFSNPMFDNTKIHALVEATMPEDLVAPNTQEITYSSFDKVTAIDEGDRHLSYRYGYNQQRIALTETNGSTTRKKQYVDNCEFVNENGIEKSWTFLSGPYGVFAVVETQNGEETTHYILKDHLGSWTTVTDAEGQVEQELSYDAWGILRDPDTWCNPTQAEPAEAPMFDRGYTGHEHITLFGLINMNGRCYDPVMSGFLSVDRYVQTPNNSQGFNRYAYCMNNPLKYVDPTGWQMVGGTKPRPWSYGNNLSYEPRDFQEGSPVMINYNLGSGGGGFAFGGGGSWTSGTYGYWLTHSQNSVYNYCPPFVQAQLIQECRANPTISNKRELWENGVDYLSIGESWDENGKGSSTVRWSSGSNMYMAEYGTTFGGVSKAGAQIWSTDMSELGMGNFGLNDNFNNVVPRPILQLVYEGTYVYDGHMKTAPGTYSFDGGQHVKVVVKNNNALGVTLSLEDHSTYTYSGWLKGKHYTGDSYGFVLLPFCSKSFDFYRFNYCPISWQFELGTVCSDAASIGVEFYSEWSPNRP